jgi:hypothetical protein
VRYRFRRFAAALAALLAVAALQGCGGGAGGPSGGFFGGAGSFFGGSTRMALAPIIGTPQKVAQELTDALVAAGKERNLSITPGTGAADYTLRGYLLASSEKKGAKISYIWDVTDAKGTRVARVSGEEVIATRTGTDPWSGVDSAALRSIAGKTASQLAASVPHGGGSATPVASSPPDSRPPPSPGPTAPPPGEVMALVPPVSGAPGDGKTSLTAALKKRLFAGGVKLASAPSRSVYTVKGSVSLTEAGAGKQNIRIDWQVLDPGGKKLGTVSQQNTIPKGALNGPWGAIADAAAGAAADGIIKLLPRSKG